MRDRPVRNGHCGLLMPLALAGILMTGVSNGCGQRIDGTPATASGDRSEAPARSDPPAMNVVVILMDALRADRLGVYGNPRPTSPYIDRLARNALVFEHAYAQAPWTAPSVASLFTGTYQSVHQVTHRMDDSREFSVLDDRFVTLAEVFHAAGYRTGAFSSQAWILPETGFAQGFDDFVVASSIFDRYETDRVVRSAMGWILQHRDEPFFAYVHILNPHSPYEPPPPFDRIWWQRAVPPSMQKLSRLGIDEQWQRLLRLGTANGDPLTRDDLDYLLAMYDGEISYVDWWIGALVRELHERGMLEKTLIVITSDHGENFSEHGLFGHAQHVYNPEISIPLIFSNPKLFPEQRRVAAVVESIDVYPTLVDLIGAPRPAQLQGENLLGHERRGTAYTEGTNLKQHKIQDGEWSLIADHDLASPHLYHLGDDPGEARDVAAAHPEQVARLLGLLRRQRDLNHAHALHRNERQTTEIASEMIERLRAMGYVE